jgi:hypothetical protein
LKNLPQVHKNGILAVGENLSHLGSETGSQSMITTGKKDYL